MKTEAEKFDNDKLRYDLIPADALEELAKVYTYGARKYGDKNWRFGMKWNRIFGAIQRHLWSFWKGANEDDESKIHHLAHAAWGCFTLLNYEKDHKELDNRTITEWSSKKSEKKEMFKNTESLYPFNISVTDAKKQLQNYLDLHYKELTINDIETTNKPGCWKINTKIFKNGEKWRKCNTCLNYENYIEEDKNLIIRYDEKIWNILKPKMKEYKIIRKDYNAEKKCYIEYLVKRIKIKPMTVGEYIEYTTNIRCSTKIEYPKLFLHTTSGFLICFSNASGEFLGHLINGSYHLAWWSLEEFNRRIDSGLLKEVKNEKSMENK